MKFWTPNVRFLDPVDVRILTARSARRDSHYPQPNIPVAISCSIIVANGRATVSSIVVPGTAAFLTSPLLYSLLLDRVNGQLKLCRQVWLRCYYSKKIKSASRYKGQEGKRAEG
jgi:hypothetical protein